MCVSACGPAAPTEGETLAPGVAQALFETRANGTDVVKVRVIFPSDSNGRPHRGPFPAVVFVQGGLVPTARYVWLGQALAQRGYVVAMPDHTLDLAFFNIENGAAARALLVTPPPKSLLEGLVDPSHIAVAGHSLGGVVAAKLALMKGFRALVFQASFADGADDARLADLGMPSLSLAGSIDCQATLAQVEAGWAKLPSPTALVVVPGMTHYGFTNTDADDAVRCPPQTPIETAHEHIVDTMTAFLSSAFDDVKGANVGEAALRAVDGVEVTTR